MAAPTLWKIQFSEPLKLKPKISLEEFCRNFNTGIQEYEYRFIGENNQLWFFDHLQRSERFIMDFNLDTEGNLTGFNKVSSVDYLVTLILFSNNKSEHKKLFLEKILGNNLTEANVITSITRAIDALECDNKKKNLVFLELGILRITQNNLIEQFIQYLTLNKINQINQHNVTFDFLRKGLCNGFSICYSLMANTGKLAWWQECLKLIAAWDGELESLNKETTLCGADGATKLKLGEVFQKTLEAVYYNQNNRIEEKYKDNEGNSPNILNPHVSKQQPVFGKSFDIYRTFNEIELSETLADLKKLLEFFATKSFRYICKIQNPKHGCSIGIDESGLYFYDPNNGFFNSSDQKSITTNILYALGNGIAIRIIPLQEDLSLVKDEIIKFQELNNRNLENLSTDVLLMLETFDSFTPENIILFLNAAFNDIAIQDKVAEFIVSKSFNDSKQFGLKVLNVLVPTSLDKILDLARVNSKIKANLVNALAQIDNENNSYFESLIKTRPDIISELFSLAKADANFTDVLKNALLIKNSDNKTNLQIALLENPECILKMLEFVGSIKELINELGNALFSHAKLNNINILHLIVGNSENNEVFEKLLSLAEQEPQSHFTDNFKKAFVEMTENKKFLSSTYSFICSLSISTQNRVHNLMLGIVKDKEAPKEVDRKAIEALNSIGLFKAFKPLEERVVERSELRMLR